MTETMTVGELIKELAQIPSHTPIFIYDMDKEKDMCVQKVSLSGSIIRHDEGGNQKFFSPYYCKSSSNIEAYWAENGYCPIICLREKHPKEDQNDS